MKISVASPCKREWSKMSGDDKVRACADCKLNVYNLSALTQAEAEELVRQREGRLCVRFFMRPDGTAMTKDCPIGVSRKRRTYAVSLGAIAALFAAPVFGRQECTTSTAERTIVDDARAALFDLKVKLGLAKPMVVMGEMK